MMISKQKCIGEIGIHPIETFIIVYKVQKAVLITKVNILAAERITNILQAKRTDYEVLFDVDSCMSIVQHLQIIVFDVVRKEISKETYILVLFYVCYIFLLSNLIRLVSEYFLFCNECKKGLHLTRVYLIYEA